MGIFDIRSIDLFEKAPHMPAISMFYGIIVYMYFRDDRRHKSPHIHVKYQNDEVVIKIPEGMFLREQFRCPR